MNRFNALGRGMQIMLVAGVLLLVDTFLPWQDFAKALNDITKPLGDLGLGDLADEFDVSTTANAWHGLFGVLLGLLVLVLVAWIVVRLAAVDIPLPVSSAMTAAVLGTLITFFAVAKSLFQEGSTTWAYVGAALAVLVGVGAWRTVQEAGGVKTLASEIPSMPKADEPPGPPMPTSPQIPDDVHPPVASTSSVAPVESTPAGPEAPVAATAVEPVPDSPPAVAGSSATEPDLAPEPQGRFCENCGAERRPGARFCTSCGQA